MRNFPSRPDWSKTAVDGRGIWLERQIFNWIIKIGPKDCEIGFDEHW